MQEAIPYFQTTTLKTPNKAGSIKETVPVPVPIRLAMKRMVEENAVIVFARKGCCMSYVVKRLLQGLGANPAVCELEERFEHDVAGELPAADGGKVQLPVVFIGGRCFGGLDRIMASHITGELTPLLKQAGALWL